ncbi:DUF6452 family protein [Seonamhaeicola aphaedonensis]|uniref:Uncharacterized protein n=1 Tax=Seonamhaeicola aphaedonensis TaxID=1461338 RepID=A0A3D9HL47_9FLAO|nr:DUF6452 family protein [Seonamhaeicola aphaedonensis]RED49626.1 hypothetical protein DFQ02_102405 [Seonamhaeicola aphaedonensis]
MKFIRYSLIPIIALLVGISISCERDDICPESTPTTPRLIIDLYDAENPENKKSAFNLVVFGEDNESILPGYNSVSTTQLILPLKTDGSPTRYVVHKDFSFNDNGTPDDPSDDIIGGNQDILIINYALTEVYVSRACGYKTVYESVEIVPEADGDNWILSTENLTNNEPIEDESATHFNILH